MISYIREKVVPLFQIINMKIKEVVAALERFAPLPLQEGYDNAGLQIGLTEAEASGVLLCLDVTEPIIREAEEKGCNLIISHHPLLFRGLNCISGRTYTERCVRQAVLSNIAICSEHTNLDNASGGVNFKIAQKLQLQNVRFLLPAGEGGSGIIGELPEPVEPLTFLNRVKSVFGVDCLMHNEGPNGLVRRVALCGGAGDFLLEQAILAEADVFLTGEMGYHHYFGHENDLWIGVLGHYQSEKFTIELMQEILIESFPDLRIFQTEIDTNPIHYLK